MVSYSFTENLNPTRAGHITLLGNTITVRQFGPFTLGATNLFEGSYTGSDSVVLAVAPNTASWTNVANVPWLHLSPASVSGTGSTIVVFSFDANPGSTRSGTISIAGQTLTVTQAGSTYVKAGQLTSLVSSGLSGPHGLIVDGLGPR